MPCDAVNAAYVSHPVPAEHLRLHFPPLMEPVAFSAMKSSVSNADDVFAFVPPTSCRTTRWTR